MVKKFDTELFHLLLEAGKIATKVHTGQKDKGGYDYIGHPERVSCALSLKDFGDRSYNLKLMIVALLHDTIEDSNGQVTKENIEQIFGKEIADAVDAVSRRKNESYDDFIERCMYNKLARLVKMEDLKDNMDIMRLVESDYEFTDKDWKRLEKYTKAYRKLKYAFFGYSAKS